METTAIHVSKEAYSQAARYALQHNTSVDKMVEKYILTLMVMRPKSPTLDAKEHTLLRLDDIAKGKAGRGLKSLKGIMASSKMTAEELREEYISDKYGV